MANITFFDLKKLIKAEIFKLNLKDSSNITKILFQNTKKVPKYVRKMHFIPFHLFCLGDLVTRIGEQ